MDVIIEALRATAWRMEPQPLFGAFHLTYTGIGLAICVLLAYLLRGMSERRHAVLLTSLGILLIISEVYKQLFWRYAIGYTEYPWIILPFHLCSMPLYILPIVAWLPKGRVREALYAFLASFCLAGGLISVLVDGGLLRDYWAMTVHSLTWHVLLVFVGLYLGLSGRLDDGIRGFARGAAVFCALALVAFLLNVALTDLSNGACDMFFVGPGPMNVAVYRDIAPVVGRPLTTLIYLLTLTIASYLCWLLATHLPKRRFHSAEKQQ
ncbi:MAG: YwaF family protein, partial [Coriobacteriales bacterium]|nr:YwaF family protein [Coriobacteriales bacterium]